MTAVDDVPLGAVAQAYAALGGGSAGIDVELLVMAAQDCGLLDGVVVHRLVPVDFEDDSFVVTVAVTSSTTVASTPVHLREVAPPGGMVGHDGLGYALSRLADLQEQLESDFAECVKGARSL